ncbi:hypothetical protein [Microtetraspora malaysiensis]|uniref:hypothetical protein n=1 Tax=Microtetraspora malaysiensis TaxID=161358 RepID=UPI003D94169E
MNRFRHVLALFVLTVASAGIVAASPAQASVSAEAACPAASKAEAKRSKAGKVDEPARGSGAIKGLVVGYIPTGFKYGSVNARKGNGITEYGYSWRDDRNDVDLKHRELWVRVVCWPDAHKLSQLKKLPVDLAAFTGDVKTEKIGGRRVVTKQGDGALGHGQYVGWVEREGIVITLMASQPLVPDLGKIIKGIRLS